MASPKVLRPGQAGKIKIKVETGKSPGEHVKSVTIRTNDPNDPTHLLQFVFDVKG